MFELKKIRSEFPILSKKRNEKSFIYFDNAATTQKPQEVISEICDFYTHYNSLKGKQIEFNNNVALSFF